jgi:hypothetical protein
MMEAVRTSETSVDNHFTRQYNPEDSSEHLDSSCSLFALCFVVRSIKFVSAAVVLDLLALTALVLLHTGER